jgi:hypothetical protein
MLLAFPSTAFANQCANTIINKTKNNLGSMTAFTSNVCKPYLSVLAKHPVRKNWKNLSAAEQAQQVQYACGVFYSVANRLAKFDPTKIEWIGNVGRYDGETIKVGFTGKCAATTACIKDYPCLENMITDFRKLSK